MLLHVFFFNIFISIDDITIVLKLSEPSLFLNYNYNNNFYLLLMLRILVA